MNELIRPYFQTRYVKLHFTVVFTEDTRLPRYKVSALRGGMGEMLLNKHCVRDRKCEDCDFKADCLVPGTMYSRMEKQPAFMGTGDSVGYVLECENYQEFFHKGEALSFQLLLLGKTIVYFSQFLDAFYMLGMYGLGKNRSMFQIVSVTNSKKQDILSGNDVHMEYFRIMRLEDYVNFRTRQILEESVRSQAPSGTGVESDVKPELKPGVESILNEREKGGILTLKFQSPLAQKMGGEFLREFSSEAVMISALRRLYILNCFENADAEELRWNVNDLPVTIRQDSHEVEIPRYSNRHSQKVFMKGIEGSLTMDCPRDEMQMACLIAGELVHIGKNTSFGFGRYRIFSHRSF